MLRNSRQREAALVMRTGWRKSGAQLQRRRSSASGTLPWYGRGARSVTSRRHQHIAARGVRGSASGFLAREVLLRVEARRPDIQGVAHLGERRAWDAEAAGAEPATLTRYGSVGERRSQRTASASLGNRHVGSSPTASAKQWKVNRAGSRRGLENRWCAQAHGLRLLPAFRHVLRWDEGKAVEPPGFEPGLSPCELGRPCHHNNPWRCPCR